jgi:hypothetical protein
VLGSFALGGTEENIMKEFAGTARNIIFAQNDDDSISPRVELIIIGTEPTWKLGVDDMIRERISETYRLTFSRKGIKMLTKSLLDIDKELEKLEKQFAPKEESAAAKSA